MTSFPSNFTPIYKKNEDIIARQTIPATDIPILGKRLAIVCAIPPTQERGANGLKRIENREYLARSRERRVREIYLEVLEKFPDIFLAFILTVSPKACRQFNVRSFLQQHTKQPLALCDDASLVLWRIATEHGIEKTARFQKLIKSLFGLPSPRTDAEGERNWSLVLSNLTAVRICLGDAICDAIQCSPRHDQKRVGSHYSECVKTNIPYDADQDAIVYIDVGSALKLADMLFPAATERIASVLPNFSPIVFQPDDTDTVMGQAKQASSHSPEIDFACFTLRGASVSAIGSLFGVSICEGIDRSELRSWEKDHLLLDATDCITMQLRREQPEHRRLRLRIGFWAGVSLVNELYSTSS